MPHKFAIGDNVEFHPATGRTIDAARGPYVVTKRSPGPGVQVFSTGSNIRPSRTSALRVKASCARPDTWRLKRISTSAR